MAAIAHALERQNTNSKRVIPRHVAAAIEGDFVVFLIGMRINKWWKPHKWLPPLRAMRPMLEELSTDPESGLLGFYYIGNLTFIQYWRSFDHLKAFARERERLHWKAWTNFNRTMKDSRGDVGIWHETYLIKADSTQQSIPECRGRDWRARGGSSTSMVRWKPRACVYRAPGVRAVPDLVGMARSATQVTKWSATIVANLASTYALDMAATTAGVVLVASGLLSGIGLSGALIVLGGSYLLWIAALSSSLAANWQLLETTGTSTSILSKLAYDLTRRFTTPTGLRRFASAAGYVLFELVKETPYYLGAFGLVFASDAISAEEALIFLAGANAGAAIYEYCLGWSTRVLLRNERHQGYASFEKAWTPAEYLADYYSEVDVDEQETIAFFSEEARRMPAGEPALVFGAGPTLHHVFPIVTRASEIHLGDYLTCNLDEITRWIGQEEGAHDWKPFVDHTLQCEGAATPKSEEIFDRECLARARITALLEVDVRRDSPLTTAQRQYATVLSAFCADSATPDREEWRLYMRRIIGLVRPGGTLLLAALGQTHAYYVGGKAFPSPALDEGDVARVLQDHFPETALTVKTVPVPECAQHGYSSIILAAGHSRNPEADADADANANANAKSEKT